MDFNSFLIGFISASVVYALFSEGVELEEYTDMTDHTELEINDFSGRNVIMSCQTCRKLKKHKELEPNLYQCVKCKRHVDLRPRNLLTF